MLLNEVIHPAGAHHIDQYAVDGSALIDGHLGLGDGAVARQIAAEAAVKVKKC